MVHEPHVSDFALHPTSATSRTRPVVLNGFRQGRFPGKTNFLLFFYIPCSNYM
jgi:hypothetical protein